MSGLYTDKNENVDANRATLVDSLMKIREELADWIEEGVAKEKFGCYGDVHRALIDKTIGATADAIESHCQIFAVHPGDVGSTPFIEGVSTDFFAKVNS